MNAPGAHPLTYQVVLRGEFGDDFGVLFDGMRIQRDSGTTVLTGEVRDQAHLAGIIERTQELGLEIVSLGEVPLPQGG